MDASPKRYDVFLSYNHNDKDQVFQIERRLREAGLNPFLDALCLPLGVRWQDELPDALEASSAAAIFLGPSGLGNWQREEMITALDMAVKDPKHFFVLAVLLPGADADAAPAFLKNRSWANLRSGVDGVEGFQQLLAGIKGEATGSPSAPPDVRAPYRGLESFGVEHADFFFGREEEVRELAHRVETQHFVAVVGASGSGKSSLVHAGLRPELLNNIFQESSRWRVLSMQPQADPERALANEVGRLLSPVDPVRAADEFGDRLRSRPDALRTALGPSLGGNSPPVLLIVDQFEELFTSRRQDSKASNEITPFAANIVDAVQRSDGWIRVLVALRADFYSHCISYSYWAELLQNSTYILRPLTTKGLIKTVERPAEIVRIRFEKDLVSCIVADFEREPGGLPLLEYALRQLWEKRDHGYLTFKAYTEIGGVWGALEKRAEDLYKGLSDSQKLLARSIFLRLANPAETGMPPTRCIAQRSELYPMDNDPHEVDAVLEILSKKENRLVTADETTVEVVHDTLLQNWSTLRGWLEEFAAAVRTEKQLSQAAQEWEKLNRDPGALYRGVRLDLAQELKKSYAEKLPLTKPEREFLDASKALRDREEREKAERELKEKETERKELAQAQRSNRLLRVGVGMLLLVVALLVFLGRQSLNVFSLADQQALATSQGLANESLHLLGDDPDLSLSKALEALPGPTPRPYVPEAEFALAQAVRVSLERGHVQLGEDVAQVAWSDGNVLLSRSKHSVRAWRDGVQLGETYLAAEGEGDITCASWRPRSEPLQMAICHDHLLYLWSPTGGKEPVLTAPLADTLREVHWSQDGSHLVIVAWGPDDLTVRPVEVSSSAGGLTVAVASGANGAGFIAPLADDAGFPAPHRFVAWSSDGGAALWSATGERLATLVDDGDALNDVWISPDGKRLLVSAPAELPALWSYDALTATIPSGRLAGMPERITAVAWGDRYLATGGTDGAIHVWDTSKPMASEVLTLHGHKPPPNSPRADVLALRWQETVRLLSFGKDGSLRLWQVLDDRGEPLCRGTDKDGAPLCTHLSSRMPHDAVSLQTAFWLDQETVLAVDKSGTGWRWSPGEPVSRSLSLYPGRDVAIARQPGGPLVLAYDRSSEQGGPGGTVWDLDRDVPVASAPVPIANAFWTDIGLVLSTTVGPARLWDIASARLTELPGPTRQKSFLSAASGHGDRLALGWSDGSVDVWDRRSGKIEHHYPEALEKDRLPIKNLEWSADGRRLLSVGCKVRLWDAERRTEPLLMLSADDAVCTNLSATFSPGAVFVAASTGAELTVFDVATGRELPAARGIHDNTVGDIGWRSGASWPYPERDRSITNRVIEVLSGTRAHAARDWLLLTRSDRTVRMWRWDPRMKSLEEIWRVSSPDSIARVEAGPSGVMTFDGQGIVRVWQDWSDDPAGLLAEAEKSLPSGRFDDLIGVSQ